MNTHTFKEIDAAAWHARVPGATPFHTPEWETTLATEFPFLHFRYFIYRDVYALRLVSIRTSSANSHELADGRFSTVPFSDGGDMVALTDVPLSLATFRADSMRFFGHAFTIRVHEYFCPVTDTESAQGDIIDFRIALNDFSKKSLRKTLRHIIEDGLPRSTEIRRPAAPADMQAAYRIYLRAMRTAAALVISPDMFMHYCASNTFVFVVDGVIRGISIFIAGATRVHYFLSASDRLGKEFHAPHHLLFHALTAFTAAGKEEMFLGGTQTDASLRTFKEGWRGAPHTLYTISNAQSRERARRSPLKIFWRLLPLSFTPKASKLVLKYLS